MASAGQAQAHSSQPTHFSSPSGQRFSWWRPWNRGAVTFGLVRVLLGEGLAEHRLEGHTEPGDRVEDTHQDCSSRVVSSVGRPLGRHRVGTAGLGCVDVRRLLADQRPRPARAAAGCPAGAPGSRRRRRRSGRPARARRARRRSSPPTKVATISPTRITPATTQKVGVENQPSRLPSRKRGHGHQPDQRDRDQPLPAEAHELVVAQPGQGAAQPDEQEQEEQDLEHEPEQAPPALVQCRAPG